MLLFFVSFCLSLFFLSVLFVYVGVLLLFLLLLLSFWFAFVMFFDVGSMFVSHFCVWFLVLAFCFCVVGFLFQDGPLLFLLVVLFVLKHDKRFVCASCFLVVLGVFFFGPCLLILRLASYQKHLSKNWKFQERANENCTKMIF